MNLALHKIYRGISAALFRNVEPVHEHPKKEFVRRLRSSLDDIAFHSNLQSFFHPDSCPLLVKQPAVDLFCIRDCWLSGAQGYIFFDKRTPLAQGGVSPRKMKRPLPVLSLREESPLFYLAENSVSRAHAIMEHLSRFQIARSSMPSNVRVVVQKGQSAWHAPYLAASGATVPPRETSDGTVYAKKLYFVPLAGESVTNLIGEPEHYTNLRRNALRYVRPQTKPVFISRADAPRRRLLNENQIFETARRFLPDIERVCLGGLSFDEQLEVVAGAPVIIAPHGQGSHLCLFAERTLSIQLVPGEPALSNPYFECALLFDYFTSLGGQSLTLSCASEAHMVPHSHDDWFYPETKFEQEIALALRFRAPDCRVSFD